jgi:hypothetical protein
MNIVTKVLAQAPAVVGEIKSQVKNPYGAVNEGGKGFGLLLANGIRMVFVAAGIFALFNIVIAGFQYMTAGGDSKAMTEAWSRIWLTLVGLILMVGAFVLAAIFGFLLFGDATFMLQPRIYTP